MHAARVAPEKTDLSARPAVVPLSAERMEKRMSTYIEKLKDPRWQKKRLEILNRDEWMCSGCGATDKTLHVHHAYYASGRDPWDYPSPTLAAFCEDCHHDEEGTSDGTLTGIEFLLEQLCALPPDGFRVERILADIGVAFGEAGREWRMNNRRRLTELEWGAFCNQLTVLLESKFAHEPQHSISEAE